MSQSAPPTIGGANQKSCLKLFSPFLIRVDEACGFARFTSRGGRLADSKVTGVTCEDGKLADSKVTGVTCEDGKLADGKVTGVTCEDGKLADGKVTGVTCEDGKLADGKVTGVTCEDGKLADGKVTGVTCEDGKLVDGKVTGITCGGGKLADVTCVNGTLPSDVDKLESTEEDELERKGSGVNISGELDSLEDLKKLVKANWVFCFPLLLNTVFHMPYPVGQSHILLTDIKINHCIAHGT